MHGSSSSREAAVGINSEAALHVHLCIDRRRPSHAFQLPEEPSEASGRGEGVADVFLTFIRWLLTGEALDKNAL